MKKLVLMLLSAAAFSVNAQVVSLFAGSPYVGDGAYSGATGAINKFSDSFSMPWAITPDTSGRFWITDQHNLSLIIGSNNYVKGGYTGYPNDAGAADYQDKTGTQSRFANPAGCAVHPKTNRVYVCDPDNNLIRYQTNSVQNATDLASWSTLAGVHSFLGGFKDGATSIAEFASPQDIAITSNGSIIYICDRDNHCIRKISGGTVSTIAGLGTTSGDVDATGTAARFYAPTGIYLVDDNTLLVADRNNSKIKQIDLTNNKVTTVVTGLNFPTDMVVVNGIMYIADSYCIRAWNGTSLSTYAGKFNVSGYVNASDITARFSNIMHISYHPKTKSIYITDLGNNVFRQLTVIQPPVADFVGTRTNPTVNEVVVLKSTSLYTTSFVWNINPTSYTLQNGSTLSDSIVYVTFNSTGSYTVDLTAYNPTGNNKITKSNYINVSLIGANKPVPDFYADKTTAAVGQTVSFIDQTTDNPASWSWTFTPNTVTYQNSTSASSRFPKVSFNATGKYTVELTSTNTNGSNTKSKVDYITVAATGTEVIGNSDLNVYPNPATDKIFVGFALEKVVVVSSDGRTVSKQVVNGVISLDGLSSGVYVVQGIGVNGNKYTGRFVKLNP